MSRKGYCIEDEHFIEYEEVLEYVLTDILIINEEDVNEIDEDFSIIVEITELRKVYTFTDVDYKHMVDTFICEENYPYNREDEYYNKYLKVMKESFDIEKANEMMPELYMPTGGKIRIKKKDIVNYIEDN